MAVPAITVQAITVHVQLPTSTNALTQPEDDDSNWAWAPWLRIPIAEFRAKRLVNSRREPMRSPFKWVRFLTGITLSVEGRFQVHAGATDFTPYDLDSPLPDESIDHVELDERQRMLPSDLEMLDGRTTTHTSRRNPLFSRRVGRRDGTCVLSNLIFPCRAAHLVPHGKGDEYIASLTRTKTGVHTRGTSQDDVVPQIDAMRNGVYLNPGFHSRLGRDLAFMVTPNFAMDTSDLDPSMQPTDYCCTAHVFEYGDPTQGFGALWLATRRTDQGSENMYSGASVRKSANNWPPDILFNAAYGVLAFKVFGFEDSAKTVEEFWGERLRSGVIETPTQRAQAQMEAKKLAIAQKGLDNSGDSDSSITDNFDAMHRSFYRFCLPQIAQMRMREQQERESALQAASVEKVSHWLGK